MRDAIEPCLFLVIGANDVPRCLRGVGRQEHLVTRSRVIVPALPGLNIHRAQLPLAQRILHPRLEAAGPLLLADLQPIFGEAVTPAEELGNSIVAADDPGPAQDAIADADIGTGDISGSNRPVVPRSDPGTDPWLALVQVGAQLVAALVAANDPKAPAHRWIERVAATGARSLKMPLPPPETLRQLADAFSALADGLRGRTG